MSNETSNRAFLRQQFHDVKFDIEGSDYDAVETIGSGTYGVVSSAIQRSTGKRVAIKKIPNIFENCVLAKRTLRELKILRHFHHDNIIAICDVLRPKEDEESFRDVYLVMDLMETDLYQIIRSNQLLTDEHIRYFVYQIACGLKYIHSANVIHRDLKPSNLIVNGNCLLKIADFGMARCVSSDEGDRNLLMTWYVATRWYRAPELMLFKQKYTGAVDIWSLGCIVAELLGRQPIFPGRNFTNQIQLIFGIIGSPNEEFVQMSHADRIKDFIRNFGQKDPVPLRQLYPTSHPKATRLLEKMLKLNPNERISAVDILSDLYLNQFHDPSAEPVCPEPFAFDLDEQNLEAGSLRRMIYNEITKGEDPAGSSVSEHQRNPARPDSTSDETRVALQPSVMRESSGHHSVVVDKNSLTDHLLAAISDSLNEEEILQHSHRIPFNMLPQCKHAELKYQERPMQVATLSTNCPTKVATLPPNSVGVKSCATGVLDLPQSITGHAILLSNATKGESTLVQSAGRVSGLVSDLKLKKLDASDLLSNGKSSESHAKSVSRLNWKNDRGKTNLSGGEPRRGGRRGRGGRSKGVMKSLKPVSLFNELGERIDVKAVLKDSILSGQQNGELRRFVNRIPVEKDPTSKLNKAVVTLSDDDKILLKRWSEMQRAAATVAPVAVAPAASVTKKTIDSAATTDNLVSVPIATLAPSTMYTIRTLHSELLPSLEKVDSGQRVANTSSAVTMIWSPSVRLSSGEIRSILDMQGQKRWSEMQRAAAAVAPVVVAPAASVTKKTIDSAATTDNLVSVPIATLAPTTTCTITTLHSELLPSLEKVDSGQRVENTSSAVTMIWSPSVRLSSGEIRSVLDMQGDFPCGTKTISPDDINAVYNAPQTEFICDISSVQNADTTAAGDRCSVLDVRQDSAIKIGNVGDSLDHVAPVSWHQYVSEGRSTAPTADQSGDKSRVSILDYSAQSLCGALSLHDISPESFKFVGSCDEKMEEKMWMEEIPLRTDGTLWNGRAPMLAGGDAQLSIENLSPVLSSGKLSLSGYGIGMDFEASFPEEFSNLTCDHERPKTSSASFISDWLGVSDPLVTSDLEDVLNMISDM